MIGGANHDHWLTVRMYIVFGYSSDIFAWHLPFRVVDNLRERSHPFTLSEYYTAITHGKSFVLRSLYNLI